MLLSDEAKLPGAIKELNEIKKHHDVLTAVGPGMKFTKGDKTYTITNQAFGEGMYCIILKGKITIIEIIHRSDESFVAL